MKKLFKILTSLVLGVFMISSCSPEEFGLGSIDVKPTDLVEGIAFKIEHDPQNPNIVYLTNLMDKKYTPLWDHPQGLSQEQKVTLKIAFPGVYEVKFGVQTRGGVVYGEPTKFTVNDMYAGFISDEMWTMIAGGAGEEKTWYLDLDAEGLSRRFLGPMYFFRNWYTWNGLHTQGGDNYLDADVWDWKNAITPTEDREGEKTSGNPIAGVQAWYWLADWKGNQWMTESADFGSMTFDLKNAANVTVDQQAYGLGSSKGTFMLDTETKMIKFSGARPVHDKTRDADDVDWYNVRILYLTKDAMQLGIVPNGDAASMTVYNYISKDYKDNWVPGNQAEPEPPYKGDANTDLTSTVTTTRKWTLSLQNPYDWTNLAGDLLNGWSTPQDYMNTGWAPYDQSLISKVSLTMTKTGSSTGSYTFTDGAGNPIAGSYSIDDKNNIVFDKAISFGISGWVNLATGAGNSLRLLRSETDASGNVTGIWLGQRSSEKDEYMAFHFKGSTASTSSDPLAAWKTALVGKTFKPDVNWFVDWVGAPTSFAGGWTSASTFGNDFNSNSWVWNKDVRDVAESASLSFSLEGNDIKVLLKQNLNGKPHQASGTVKIDPDKGILTFNIPLVDYAGTVADWLPTTNTKSLTGSVNDWYFVSHGGANLSNINTQGLWLGVMSNSVKAGDDKDEVLVFHYIKTD